MLTIGCRLNESLNLIACEQQEHRKTTERQQLNKLDHRRRNFPSWVCNFFPCDTLQSINHHKMSKKTKRISDYRQDSKYNMKLNIAFKSEIECKPVSEEQTFLVFAENLHDVRQPAALPHLEHM
jgi:hypothetical protein